MKGAQSRVQRGTQDSPHSPPRARARNVCLNILFLREAVSPLDPLEGPKGVGLGGRAPSPSPHCPTTLRD